MRLKKLLCRIPDRVLIAVCGLAGALMFGCGARLIRQLILYWS
jgi:hypothetical protein